MIATTLMLLLLFGNLLMWGSSAFEAVQDADASVHEKIFLIGGTLVHVFVIACGAYDVYTMGTH